MEINEALQNIGLNSKETAIYTSLLQLGEATAYAIAERSKLKRPTVYVILEELQEKGLVLKVPHAKKQLFTAKSPEDFIRETQEKVNAAKSVLPQLLSMMGGKQKPRTLYFEGVNGIKEVLDYGLDRMADKEMVGFYAYAPDLPKEMFGIFDKYNDKLKRYKIKARGIVPDHPSLKEYRKRDIEYGRTMRVVPYDEYSSKISIDIGPTFIRLLDFENLQGTVIQNKDIANTLRQFFEMLWKSLPQKN